jgi:hypothetical protein
LKVKITIMLSYDGLPLDGDISLFIDKAYWKTVTTVGGYYEEVADITGKRLTAIYWGTDDYEASYATVLLPIVAPPLAYALALVRLLNEIDRAMVDEARERAGLPPITDEELEELREAEDWFYEHYPE